MNMMEGFIPESKTPCLDIETAELTQIICIVNSNLLIVDD